MRYKFLPRKERRDDDWWFCYFGPDHATNSQYIAAIRRGTSPTFFTKDLRKWFHKELTVVNRKEK